MLMPYSVPALPASVPARIGTPALANAAVTAFGMASSWGRACWP
jgi:hypothetical protein